MTTTDRKDDGLREGADGRWSFVLSVSDGRGKRRQLRRRGFASKKDAVSARDELRADVKTGHLPTSSRETVAAYMERWLVARQASVKPSTWASYRQIVDAYVTPGLGSLQLRRLDGLTLTAFYGDLLANGATGARSAEGKGRPLAPKTVRNVAGMLHKAFKDAVRWSVLTSNPADSAELPRRSAPEMKAWTVDQVGVFLLAAEDHPQWIVWRLLLMTGARRGEVLGLDWRDIDLAGGRITIRQTWSMAGNKPMLGSPKTASGSRVVALDTGTVVALKRWKSEQGRYRLAMGAGWPTTTAVVTEQDGQRVHPQVLTRRFKALCRDLDVTPIRLHDLRHTVASVALAHGEDVTVLSRRLGHADVGVTLKLYRHVMPGEDQAAADRMASLFGGIVTNM
jgi:integrase